MIVLDTLRKRESLQQMKDSLPSWCNPEQSQQLNMLKVRVTQSITIHLCVIYLQSTFPSMYASLDLGNAGMWTQFASSSQCEREFPPSLMKKISPFQQVSIPQLILVHIYAFTYVSIYVHTYIRMYIHHCFIS